MLLHGFPYSYSIDSFVDVAPMLAARGARVIVPFLRGHGSTRIVESTTPRGPAGGDRRIPARVQGCVEDPPRRLGRLRLGQTRGLRGRRALAGARCAGLVSVNSYLIHDIANAGLPVAPTVESSIWYQHYFLSERGRAGLTANRREIARTIWLRNSPGWHFDDATLERHAAASDNSDYVDVAIHSYRHRLGPAEGFPAYVALEQRLTALPVITVPTITMDGKADGVVPATDGKITAAKFTGPRSHRVVVGAGHNLPEEAPQGFADAAWELAVASRGA